jgi:hypothetical protein
MRSSARVAAAPASKAFLNMDRRLAPQPVNSDWFELITRTHDHGAIAETDATTEAAANGGEARPPPAEAMVEPPYWLCVDRQWVLLPSSEVRDPDDKDLLVGWDPPELLRLRQAHGDERLLFERMLLPFARLREDINSFLRWRVECVGAPLTEIPSALLQDESRWITLSDVRLDDSTGILHIECCTLADTVTRAFDRKHAITMPAQEVQRCYIRNKETLRKRRSPSHGLFKHEIREREGKGVQDYYTGFRDSLDAAHYEVVFERHHEPTGSIERWIIVAPSWDPDPNLIKLIDDLEKAHPPPAVIDESDSDPNVGWLPLAHCQVSLPFPKMLLQWHQECPRARLTRINHHLQRAVHQWIFLRSADAQFETLKFACAQANVPRTPGYNLNVEMKHVHRAYIREKGTGRKIQPLSAPCWIEGTNDMHPLWREQFYILGNEWVVESHDGRIGAVERWIFSVPTEENHPGSAVTEDQRALYSYEPKTFSLSYEDEMPVGRDVTGKPCKVAGGVYIMTEWGSEEFILSVDNRPMELDTTKRDVLPYCTLERDGQAVKMIFSQANHHEWEHAVAYSSEVNCSSPCGKFQLSQVQDGVVSSTIHRWRQAHPRLMRFCTMILPVLIMALGLISDANSLRSFSYLYSSQGAYGSDELIVIFLCTCVRLLITAPFLIKSARKAHVSWKKLTPMQPDKIDRAYSTCSFALQVIVVLLNIRILGSIRASGVFSDYRSIELDSASSSFAVSVYLSLLAACISWTLQYLLTTFESWSSLTKVEWWLILFEVVHGPLHYVMLFGFARLSYDLRYYALMMDGVPDGDADSAIVSYGLLTALYLIMCIMPAVDRASSWSLRAVAYILLAESAMSLVCLIIGSILFVRLRDLLGVSQLLNHQLIFAVCHHLLIFVPLIPSAMFVFCAMRESGRRAYDCWLKRRLRRRLQQQAERSARFARDTQARLSAPRQTKLIPYASAY